MIAIMDNGGNKVMCDEILGGWDAYLCRVVKKSEMSTLLSRTVCRPLTVGFDPSASEPLSSGPLSSSTSRFRLVEVTDAGDCGRDNVVTPFA